VARAKVVLSGPLFDGEAQRAADAFLAELSFKVALSGQLMIKTEAHGFDKSGRNSGAAAGGVELVGQGQNYVIRGGIRAGQYSWPWLEGVSQRNTTTGFKGYKTFSRTRARMRKQVTPWAQGELAKFVAAMGGGEA
jgi:hypothetical protein